MTIQETDRRRKNCIGHLPENPGTVGQDTKDGNRKVIYYLLQFGFGKIGTGKYEIVYGAESQYMKCISRVMLEMDGLVYCINYRGVYPNWDKYGEEGLGQMAAEIIRAGEKN